MAATSNQTGSSSPFSSPWQVCLACLLILFLVPVVNKLPLLFDFIVGKVYKLFGWNYRKTETTPPASKISDILDSSSSSSGRWHVFLSFRGKDIRKTFVDHLYTALDRAGIQTFKDDPQLRKGEEISSALLNAIQHSRMSIVVFSKNYASSRWCLDELAEIVECKRAKGQTLYPVFYDVDPSDVRHQLGSFAKAIEKHKLRFTDKKIEIWRDALTEASNLSGYNLKNDFDGYESKFIKNIVNNVSREVNPKALNVDMHLVEVNSHVADIYEKISIGSSNLCVVGIHGMGGVGKTTIAKVFYNKYLHCFERHCFLENVRENSQSHGGPLFLVQKLVSALLEKQDFSTVDEGISILKERVRTKKVLIVVDDLDKSSQSKLLVRCWNFFGSESRIIITARDIRMLDEFEKMDEGYMVKQYMVKTLSKNKSLELLSYHAFGRKNFRERTVLEDFREILERIVSYTGGLPLAVKFLGSLLYGRTMEEWTSILEKLQQIPNNEIQTILKISYDALDSKQKEIFLDIAFFFDGMDKEEANHLLDSSGFFPHDGIKILEERCLLTIDMENKLRMHDLIRDMGREIVRQESIKQPRKRSRLWCQEEVRRVLKNQKGTTKIEGIRLDITALGPKYFDAKTFESMPNLRLLQIDNVHLTGSFENSFKELRWLRWRYCPLTCLPPSFHAPELVSLDMQYSNVNTLWEDPKYLKSLKFLNASYTSIQRLPDSIGHLSMLLSLELSRCNNLRNLPNSICNLSSLVKLHLDDCNKLEGLPAELGNMKSLQRLLANHTAIEQLPDSVGHLSMLVSLELSLCNNLRNLPDSICNMKSLRELGLGGCHNLRNLPDNICNLSSLEGVRRHLSMLVSLELSRLSRCKDIRILNMKYLRVCDCHNLDLDLPDSIWNMLIFDLRYSIRNMLNLRGGGFNLDSIWNMIIFDLRYSIRNMLEDLPGWIWNMLVFHFRYSIHLNLKGGWFNLDLPDWIWNMLVFHFRYSIRNMLEDLKGGGGFNQMMIFDLGNNILGNSIRNMLNLVDIPQNIWKYQLSIVKRIFLFYCNHVVNEHSK